MQTASPFNPHTDALVSAAQGLNALIASGELFQALDGDAQLAGPATTATDDFQRALATFEWAEAHPYNPFERYRKEIRGGYSTGQRLARLVLHLFNSRFPCDLATLMAGADSRHRQIALELIHHYARYGENCPTFMTLARELVARDHPELIEDAEA